MKPKVRNHLASLCMRYVAKLHPQDFKTLALLSEENYQYGFRDQTLETVFRKFMKEYEIPEAVEGVEAYG